MTDEKNGKPAENLPMGITIRSASPDDAERLLPIYRPYVTDTAITFEYDVPDAEEFRKRIERNLDNGYPYLVLEQDGRAAGYAYASRFRERKAYDYCAEISIYLDRDARHRGLGRLLYERLEAALRKSGIRDLIAVITVPSEEPDPYLPTDSPRFHRSCGFSDAGCLHRCGYKFGRWYHVCFMEKNIN